MSSLFGSIQMGANTLRAQQIGLQVTGQNIANANTPGYVREEVIFKPAPSYRYGGLILGLGVEVAGIIQKSDTFLENRLRTALSDQEGAGVEEDTYLQLEGIVGELSDTDLSTSLNNFFNSVSEILNQPESDAARNLAVLKGQTLAGDLNRLATRVGTLRENLNERVEAGVSNVNRLLEEIRVLNIKIANTEGGDVSNSDAVGLRDQRNTKVADLAKLIDITVNESPSGTISVYSGGDFLVTDGIARQLKISQSTDRGIAIAEPRVADTDFKLQFTSGELSGLIKSRDDVLGKFLDNIDGFANTLSFEFNKVFSSGQGLRGYSSLTSTNTVNSATAELDDAGLENRPVNGSFNVLVYNTKTKQTETTTINVDLNGLNGDTTLTSLTNQLNSVSGLSATLDSQNRLTLRSTSADQQFAFANDNSGALAALGINTFFTGSTALGLSVNSEIVKDPGKFAASRDGIGEDTKNGLDLASFQDRKLASQNDASITDLYDRLTANLTQDATIAKSVAEGARVYTDNLTGQSLAISGVNIDEEAIKMLRYQRVYQASAKYIATLDDLLQVLVNL
jgi:flagellar hook-associated protein 1